MADAEEKFIDSADALAALAGGGEVNAADALQAVSDKQGVDNEDALASLAAGEFPEPQLETPAQPVQEEDENYVFVHHETIHVDPERRKASEATRRKNMDQAHALQFKKTMIPLLIVVGVVLVLISIATIVVRMGEDVTEISQANPSMLQQYGPMLVMLACPLAAILFFGAWLFHQEVSRAKVAAKVRSDGNANGNDNTEDSFAQ